MSDVRLIQARDTIVRHLHQIAALFKGPVEITIVLRNPAFPDGSGDIVVTSDSYSDVIAALQLSERVGKAV